LNRNDYIVICGGSNDISKNESSIALKHHKICFTVPEYQYCICSCSTEAWSGSLLVSTRKFWLLTEDWESWLPLFRTQSRDKFTRHGLHLNSKGKEKVATTIGQHVVDLLNRQDMNVLTLQQTDENKDSNSQLKADVSLAECDHQNWL
jgi:lysophospholipase L1-like esterase